MNNKNKRTKNSVIWDFRLGLDFESGFEFDIKIKKEIIANKLLADFKKTNLEYKIKLLF